MWVRCRLRVPLNSIINVREPRVERGEQEEKRKTAQARECLVCRERGSVLSTYRYDASSSVI